MRLRRAHPTICSRGRGGVATETVSEDLHTTLKLQLKGYTIRYHNDALVTGIARTRPPTTCFSAIGGARHPGCAHGSGIPALRQGLATVSATALRQQPALLLPAASATAVRGRAAPRTPPRVASYRQRLGALRHCRIDRLRDIALRVPCPSTWRLEIGEGASNTYLSAEIYTRALVTTALRRKSGFAVTPKSISELTLGERLRVLALPTIVAGVIAVSWALRAAQQAFGYVVPGVVLPAPSQRRPSPSSPSSPHSSWRPWCPCWRGNTAAGRSGSAGGRLQHSC